MNKFEVIIVGGGLAGLTAAIHLASEGIEICVMEKENFPHHKVCGEYLSAEVLPYLKYLNLDLNQLHPVQINRLLYSTTTGKNVNTNLPLGGMGISRYALDNFLYEKALEKGVKVITQMVSSVDFKHDRFIVTTSESEKYTSTLVLGAFGKRSVLDKKLKRKFITKMSGWLAVKAHYTHPDYPEDLVSLHNFSGGYCGLSKVENGNINVCYLTTYKSFKNFRDTGVFKEEILCKNPFLKSFFEKAVIQFESELSIAQISFAKKETVQHHILMLGDSAGLIHPLCGNGMAMAIKSAKTASEYILQYFSDKDFSRQNLENKYEKQWQKEFSGRLKTGRQLQKILLNPFLAETGQNLVRIFPSLLPKIISKTHGTPSL